VVESLGIEPDEALFPTQQSREQWDDLLTRMLAEAQRRINNGPVTPRLDMIAFRRDLAKFDFCAPVATNELLSWTIANLEQGIVHITHPRYFGLFNPAPTFPAQCADRITATFNPQLATATTSPVPIELEAHVLRAVASRAGLPTEATGHFTTGGAEANYTALICALTRLHPAFAATGSRAFEGAPVFYVSRESHSAWFKIAHQAGIGRSAVRLVPTDGNGRLDPNALSEAIAADLSAGRVPVMIAATAGTTNAGMIDPLAPCAEIARGFGLWYHVDAAWGGALIASDGLRGKLAGLEQADSLTIDAHKWFATTMGCGMFLTPHAPVLSAAFHVSANYMPSNTVGVDPYITSVQWSRRFLGLRLFLSLASAGWKGYARHIERAIELSAMLREELEARGWSTANDSSLAVLCIEPPSGSRDIAAIVSDVLASGRAWVSASRFEERSVIRACITHGETTPEDVRQLVEALEAAREARCSRRDIQKLGNI
jgi:glutamate/tyrosine decarboxylase-like PLP-dependent enzyme